MNLMAHFVQQATTNPIKAPPPPPPKICRCGESDPKKFYVSNDKVKSECKKCAAKRLKEWRVKPFNAALRGGEAVPLESTVMQETR